MGISKSTATQSSEIDVQHRLVSANGQCNG